MKSSNLTSVLYIDFVHRHMFAPLKIAIPLSCEHYLVNCIEDAVTLLTGDFWPRRYGPDYEEALMACIDGLRERVPPWQVRQALIRAAVDAGLDIVG